MEAIENLKTRRSIRKFKSDMISKDIIEKIIEAAPRKDNYVYWVG